MAIKRLDPTAVFKIISRQDDAIEHESLQELDTGERTLEGAPILKEARYDQYMEIFDTSILKFKEGTNPTYFHVRCLNHQELAVLQEKYLQVDIQNKKLNYTNKNKMFLEVFDSCVSKMETDGKEAAVKSNDVPFAVAIEVASLITIMTNLGKNLKKP